MRIDRTALVLIMTTAASISSAQKNMGQQQSTMGPNQSIMAAILAPVTGAPYRAEKITTSRQVLSDGTVITHETRGVLARDGAGRVREDLSIAHTGQVDGREMDKNQQSVTVGDPVEHRMLMWTGGTGKIAIEMKLPSLPTHREGTASVVAAPKPKPLPDGASVALGTHADSGPVTVSAATPFPSAAGKNTMQTSDLGQQSLAGVMTTGKRITTTIPLGEVGNDRPIVVVHEEWRSPDLGILVKTLDTDPRTGEQTMELQALERVEPSEALFQAPPGYTVQDTAAMMKALEDSSKTLEDQRKTMAK